jgi:signal transduction histidine kinase
MSDPRTGADVRLLLLDDDPGILRLEHKRLEAAGYAITAVQTTGAARDALAASRYGLLVLDYRLAGGLSGLEFYQQLRAEGCDVPAMLVTAFSDESKLFEALRAGVRDVIPKSGEYLDYLPQAVARVMAQIGAERQAAEAGALRRSEERLRALNTELERSERQLRAQADELAEAGRSKDLFLATLAHELRNPLAPIRFALQMLVDLPPAHMRARDVIERQVLHLVRLVDDLLDVSRVSRNKIQLRRGRVDLEEVMRASVESVAPEAAAAGHRLTFDPPPSRIWLDGDAARLTQVFTNLLNNAVKYTPAGGAIRFAAGRDGARVRVSVTDTGLGIAATDLPHVFAMFYQAADRPQHASGGLGIGLMLVKRLVEMHGGTVDARSDGPGRGAEFVVSLPVVEAGDDGVRAPDTARPESAASALDVLVVDDNVDSATLLGLLIAEAGHTTRVAHNGVEALAQSRVGAWPRVAFLDIGLPGMSGYELARQLRREAGSAIFLVAVTGWGQEQDKRKAREAGFDCHLVKPADPAIISRVLACVADGRPCGVCNRCLASEG